MGRDVGRDGGRERKRSATPPIARNKEPTPDLTDIIPVLERKRRMTQWDIKPPGYENVTAEQAKLSGKSSLHPPICFLLGFLGFFSFAMVMYRDVSFAWSTSTTASGSKPIAGFHESAWWISR